jgi:MinD superfamily P-loop ATPase
MPVLDEDKCKKCGLCSQTCKEHAIFWVKDKYPKFIYDMCTGCGACQLVCPHKAIKMKKEKSGESFINKINDNLWLVTGQSKAGISETGPIVREVKDRAIKFAEEKNTDYLIIDTAPGTHCSVIQALMGSDRVYAVTEPTPLGAHDLSLILELLQKLGIESEIVLNKADVGDRKIIEDIAKKFKTRISIEIPYSEKLVKAYCEKDLERVVDLMKGDLE